MVELNHRDRQIKVKIVYYGPPVGGKTTNLQILHQHAEAARRGEMISINSAQDRTILFDLLPLRSAGFRGFDLRLQILAVPGQAMYATTRRLVLKNADSLVFVANSAVDRWEENLQSFREMTQNLLAHRLDPATMPLVFQYNKRDLPKVMDMEFMDRALNARKVDSIPAVAVRGEGVLETFSAILMRTIQDLAKRYAVLENTKGQPAWQWTQQAVLSMFGTTSLGGRGAHPARRVAAGPGNAGGHEHRHRPESAARAARGRAHALRGRAAVPTSPRTGPAPSGGAVPAAPRSQRGATPIPKRRVPRARRLRRSRRRPCGSDREARKQDRPSGGPGRAAAGAAHAPEPQAATAGPIAAESRPRPWSWRRPRSRARPTRAPSARGARVAPGGRSPPPRRRRVRPCRAPTHGRRRRWSRATPKPRPSSGPRSTTCAKSATAPATASSTSRGWWPPPRRCSGARSLQETLAPVLARLAEVAGASHASFLVPEGPHRLRAAALLGLSDDPLLVSSTAMRHVIEATEHDAKPRFHEAADNLEVGQALDRKDAPFAALLAVPVRTPRGLQGIFGLYYSADAARPGRGHPGPPRLHGPRPHRGPRAAGHARNREERRARPRDGPRGHRVGPRPRGGGELAPRPARAARPHARPAGGAPVVHRGVRAPRAFPGHGPAGRPLAPRLQQGRDPAGHDLPRRPPGRGRGERASVQLAPGAEAVWGDQALVRLALRAMVEHVGGTARAAAPSRSAPPRLRERSSSASVSWTPRPAPPPRRRPRASASGWCAVSPSCTAAA